MRSLLRKGLPVADRALRAVGLARVGPSSGDPFRDVDPLVRAIYETVKPFTVTGPSAVFTLCDAMRHVVRAKVPGAFVECDVFMGGSSMAAALMAKHLATELDIHLFDTFEGMPRPTERDAFIFPANPRSKSRASTTTPAEHGRDATNRPCAPTWPSPDTTHSVSTSIAEWSNTQFPIKPRNRFPFYASTQIGTNRRSTNSFTFGRAFRLAAF